ncbi:MAG: CopG family antitoxin [Candidatus Dormibacteraceae bacterium]
MNAQAYEFHDPYENVTDAEFEQEIEQLLIRGTTMVSLRIPNQLLQRVRETAKRRELPYQVLMKTLIEQGLNRLERMGSEAL